MEKTSTGPYLKPEPGCLAGIADQDLKEGFELPHGEAFAMARIIGGMNGNDSSVLFPEKETVTTMVMIAVCENNQFEVAGLAACPIQFSDQEVAFGRKPIVDEHITGAGLKKVAIDASKINGLYHALPDSCLKKNP